MFEKEAERCADEYRMSDDYSSAAPYDIGYANGLEIGFKKGAEFGYNKANEWHYVKNGDFPKDGETVLVCRDDMQIWTGNRHSKRENSYFWYIHNLHGVLYKDSDIYAWKEIVLPELKENE